MRIASRSSLSMFKITLTAIAPKNSEISVVTACSIMVTPVRALLLTNAVLTVLERLGSNVL
jgi:hypothetical protein